MFHVKIITWDYSEQVWTNELNNQKAMDKFLEIYYLQRLNEDYNKPEEINKK
jgi:hypothetical protein